MGAANSKHVTNPASVATPVDGTNNKSTVTPEDIASWKKWDYIIVGGGTAGCVLAHRLSEDKDVSVLLIEAGKDPLNQLFSRIPLTFGRLFKTESDWGYGTEPQSTLNGRSLFWPRGKMLGGCSSINAMMYLHCAPTDYDAWGIDGWKYNDLKPYFRKAEKFTPHTAHPLVDKTHRGDEGEWSTGYSFISDLGKDWIKSCEEVGIPYNPDINTPAGTLGVTEVISNIDSKGERSSTSTAYLPKPVLGRPNLAVLIDSRITRILFDPSGPEPRAVGVEIAQTAAGPRFRVGATKEVILSAGAIGTPQVLLASGVGPKEVVAKAGVELVKELPHVGRNMYDHLLGCIVFRATESLDYLATPTGSLLPLARWLLTGQGPLRSNLAEACAFFRTDDTKLFGPNPVPIEETASTSEAPNLELVCANLAFCEHGFRACPPGEKAFTIKRAKHAHPDAGVALNPMEVHPGPPPENPPIECDEQDPIHPHVPNPGPASPGLNLGPAPNESSDSEDDSGSDSESGPEGRLTGRQMFSRPPTDEAARAALASVSAAIRTPRPGRRGFDYPKLDRVTGDRYMAIKACLNHYLDPRTNEGFIDASLRAARGQGRGATHARSIRKWVRNLIKNGDLPRNQERWWQGSVLEDEDIASEIKHHLQEVGKYARAEDVVKFFDDTETRAELKINKAISIRTAQRWMARNGFRWRTEIKGQYFDGHEREDVVEYRQRIFVPFWQAVERRMVIYNDDGIPDPQRPIRLLPGEKPVLFWFHDESIFYANDRRLVRWVYIGEHPTPFKKGEGSSIMVADFICPLFGWLRGANGESARVILSPGKNREGYFTSRRVVEQLRDAVKIVEATFPEYTHVFIYNNAPSHTKRPAESLNA